LRRYCHGIESGVSVSGVPKEAVLEVVQEERDSYLIEEVLRSRSFERSRSLRTLLIYLWQHRDDDINEYAIATEALGRPSDFNSKIDATVRVQIGRLRRVLEKFYAEEGRQNLRRLTVPTGSHELSIIELDQISDSFARQTAPGAIVEEAEERSLSEREAATSAARKLSLLKAVGIGVVIGLIPCIVLLSMGVLSRRSIQPERTDAPLFWKSFLDNGKTTRIVLPAPTFFSWETDQGHSVMVRDITVNSPSEWSNSSVLPALLEKELGKPRIWHGYTVASDTFAAVQLARFLDRYGVRTRFSSSADSPTEIIDHENVVTFGTASSLAAFQSDLDRLTFRMAHHEAKVVDLLSPQDHPREFALVHESPERAVAPGIVAVIPKGSVGGRLMLVQGSHTMALISYLTSEEGMKEVGQALQSMKTPYFEAVILSEVSGGTPLQSRLGAIRAFTDGSGGVARITQVQENKK
jgi:hypothetical protein